MEPGAVGGAQGVRQDTAVGPGGQGPDRLANGIVTQQFADGLTTEKEAADAAAAFESKAPAFVKRSKTLHLTWKIGIGVVGFATIVAGIVMCVIPGPGIPAILVGLAILGTEFVWAQRALIWTKDKAARAAQAAMDPKTRRRNIIILIVGVVLLAAAAGLYLWKYGLALPF